MQHFKQGGIGLKKTGFEIRVVIGTVFLVVLIYGLSTISLIGHRPPIIFITLWFAVLTTGAVFWYSIIGKRKKLKIFITITLLMFVIYGITELMCNRIYQEKVNNISVTDVDISNIDDGIYDGECDVDYIKAKVRVEVKDHQIVNIKLLKHVNERGESAEKIVDKMVEEQKIDVDAVSSATNSSIVIKKAVENALLKK